MRTRAAELGGRLEVTAGAAGGTTVSVRLPLHLSEAGGERAR
jgi:signal transduction histidine kinase